MTNITTISGDSFQCVGVSRVTLETHTGQRAQVCALVAGEKPLGVDVVLGIAGILALGSIVLKSSSEVQFCDTRKCRAASAAPLVVDVPDFCVRLDVACVTLTWKWMNGAAPDCLHSVVAQYNVSPSMRKGFDGELECG